MNMNRRRRRWRAWDRWIDRCIALSAETRAPRGALKAHNQRARDWNHRQKRKESDG